MRFEILANGVAVGCSNLEGGDPPMGVAGGRFLPYSTYPAIQSSVVESRDGSQAHLGLVVHLADGLEVPSSGETRITDYSAELGDEAISVEVLGIPYPLYEELFPKHVAAYRAQFPQRS
jgi:hypothetical protein